MIQNIKLSICIPTYNRSFFLNSILHQLSGIEDEGIRDVIEVCISDNASTDDTEEMVTGWLNEGKVNIKYAKNLSNEGADRNYLKVVEMATGCYCWLFGSDDLFVDNAIPMLLEKINESGSDIYICNRINCDINMNPIAKQKWLKEGLFSQEFDFKDPKELLKYFENAESLGAVFSYLSSIIFKRSLWVSQVFDNSYLGSAYAHVFYLLSMVKSGCTLSYVDHFLVLNRGGNESFLDKGSANRILIDLFGYARFADEFFYNTIYYDAFLNILKNKERRQFRTIVSLRYYSLDEAEWERSKYILAKLGYSNRLISFCSILKRPLKIIAETYLKGRM